MSKTVWLPIEIVSTNLAVSSAQKMKPKAIHGPPGTSMKKSEENNVRIDQHIFDGVLLEAFRDPSFFLDA